MARQTAAMDPLWLFAALVFGIVILPGMDMAFVLASALAAGRPAGFAAVAGIVAGGLVHMVSGAIGIGLLLQVMPAAFNALLFAGALYVGWMGWSLWRQPGGLVNADVPVDGAARRRSMARTFRRAVLTCLLNPKAYVFMVAVFPQFLRPEHGALLPRLVAMSLIVALAQISVYGSVAAGAAALRRWLEHSAANQRRLARGVGGLLMLTACWTLWQSWR